MATINIVQTVTDSVGFGFKRMGLTLKLFWLPILIIAALFVALFAGSAELIISLENESDPSPEQMTQLFGVMGQFYGALILGSLVFLPGWVMLNRVAAGEQAPGGIAYFAVGAREWRTLGAIILYMIISSLVFFFAFVPGILVIFGSILSGLSLDVISDSDALAVAMDRMFENGDVSEGAILIGVLLFLVAILFAIWFSIRSSIFVPATAIDNRIDFFKVFGETKGNFWKIFFGFILLGLIQTAIQYGLMFVAMIPMMAGGVMMGSMMQGDFDPNALSGGEIAGMVLLCAIMLILILVYILFSVASSVAYPAKIHVRLSSQSD